jgi:uncharacterized membrane protein
VSAFEIWLRNTSLADLMHTAWAWPIVESLHFFGLCLLMGTVGLFDLRLLGFAKQIPLPALHRLIPWGILGYGINVCTGVSFFVAEPDQYLYNPSFQIKILFMSLAGVNVLLFYALMFRHVKTLDAGEDAPMPARIMGGASLVFWIGVMTCGRLLTFFRPPSFYWCPWC